MQLILENVSFSYGKSYKNIFENFNLQVEKGELVGLRGQSGSGKSTLLRVIAGLEELGSGKIIVEDKIISSKDICIPPEKREIGMIFQDYSLFPHLTLRKNIEFGLSKLSKEDRENRVNEMLSLIKLESYQSRYPYQLSGGQQQRVAMARSLAIKPKLLLMDEPFSSLDAELKNDIRCEIKEILNKQNMTCIIVSHDEEDTNLLCSRTIELQTGSSPFPPAGATNG